MRTALPVLTRSLLLAVSLAVATGCTTRVYTLPDTPVPRRGDTLVHLTVYDDSGQPAQLVRGQVLDVAPLDPAAGASADVIVRTRKDRWGTAAAVLGGTMVTMIAGGAVLALQSDGGFDEATVAGLLLVIGGSGLFWPTIGTSIGWLATSPGVRPVPPPWTPDEAIDWGQPTQ